MWILGIIRIVTEENENKRGMETSEMEVNNYLKVKT